MRNKLFLCLIAFIALTLSFTLFTTKTNAQNFDPFSFAVDAKEQAIKGNFMVEGQQRTALIYPGSGQTASNGAPLVFVFHGHGGNAQVAAKKFHIHTLWPEAVVVYMQGLPGIPGITDPEGKKTGWQKDPGQANDRDIKFVDVALEQILQEYRVDPTRVYALGHSNGGRFTNLIWDMRGEKFAAFCSAAGQGGQLIRDNIAKSIFIIAGENDQLVSYEGQLMSVEAVRSLLQSDPTKAVKQGFASIEPGINGTELATYLHPGGHEFPKKALPLAVMFFQRHTNR